MQLYMFHADRLLLYPKSVLAVLWTMLVTTVNHNKLWRGRVSEYDICGYICYALQNSNFFWII